MVRHIYGGLRVLLLLAFATMLAACAGGPAINVTYNDVFGRPAAPVAMAPARQPMTMLAALPPTAPVVTAPSFAQRGLPTYRASDGSGLTIGNNVLAGEGVSRASLLDNPLADVCPFSVFYNPRLAYAEALVELRRDGTRGRAIMMGNPDVNDPFWLFILAHECVHLLRDHVADGGGILINPPLELEADLGACQLLLPRQRRDAVERVIEVFASLNVPETDSHPSTARRNAHLAECLAT